MILLLAIWGELLQQKIAVTCYMTIIKTLVLRGVRRLFLMRNNFFPSPPVQLAMSLTHSWHFVNFYEDKQELKGMHTVQRLAHVSKMSGCNHQICIRLTLRSLKSWKTPPWETMAQLWSCKGEATCPERATSLNVCGPREDQ